MTAYFNEFDPNAAEWLRNLSTAGHIAHGHVDSRSIREVAPDDLAGFTQAHLFAGVGAWSYALRLAGVADDTPVWTLSCPCQPWSSAGKQRGAADDRHLWPEAFRLIRACRPRLLFGEQVSSAEVIGRRGKRKASSRPDASASPATQPWLDLVRTDLESVDYAFGAVVAPAAGAGAPHIRDRTCFVAYRLADAECGGVRDSGHGSAASATSPVQGADGERERLRVDAGECGSPAFERLAFSDREGFCGRGEHGEGRIASEPQFQDGDATRHGANDASSLWSRVVGVAHPDNAGPQGHGGHVGEHGSAGREAAQRHGAASGFWDDCAWLPCRDGKLRSAGITPAERGPLPVADGASGSVGPMRAGRLIHPLTTAKEANRSIRLKGYGNAIVAELAAEFIRSCRDVLPPELLRAESEAA